MSSTRLRSLLDMLLNYAEAFTLVVADLEMTRAQVLSNARDLNAVILGPHVPKFDEFKECLVKLLATCRQVADLDRMDGPIGRMLSKLDGPIAADDFHHTFNAMQLNLFDELRRLKLYLVPTNFVGFYENELPFGQDVFDRFPSAVPDTRNAGRCLALGQPTACMFHLMRVMERALTAYSAALGIDYSPSWESYIRALNSKMGIDWSKKEAKWKKAEPWHKEILEDLIAVKTVWRNPTMHIESDYDIEEATIAYIAVRAFMMELVKKLGEPKSRRSSKAGAS